MLKKEYGGFTLKTTDECWEKIKETNGECKIDSYNASEEDKEVYFDVCLWED